MKTVLLSLIISTLSPSLFGEEIANVVHALTTPTYFLTESSTFAQRSLKNQKKKALKGEKKAIVNNTKAVKAKKSQTYKKGQTCKKNQKGGSSSLPSSLPSSKNKETSH